MNNVYYVGSGELTFDLIERITFLPCRNARGLSTPCGQVSHRIGSPRSYTVPVGGRYGPGTFGIGIWNGSRSGLFRRRTWIWL